MFGNTIKLKMTHDEIRVALVIKEYIKKRKQDKEDAEMFV